MDKPGPLVIPITAVSVKWSLSSGGLQNSDNWVTAELMSRTSPLTFKRLLESYGLRGPIEATMAMSLGTPEATVGEMVSGYTTFVNDGVRVDPILVTQIEDMHGNIVATFAPKMTEVLTADAAHKMLYMLQNVVNGGTGGRLRSSFGLQSLWAVRPVRHRIIVTRGSWASLPTS